MANTFIFDDDEPQPDSGAPLPESDEPEQPEAGEGNNRTFLIAAIVLGGIVLLSLICMAVLAVWWLPQQNAAKLIAQNTNVAAITGTAAIDQQTQEAALFTPTLQPTDTPTFAPTETPVVVFATSTPSVAPSSDPATATVLALQTQLALAQGDASQTAEALTTGTPGTPGKKTTGTPGTPGKAAVVGTQGTPGTPGTNQVPKTGFADEVGLPGLFILSIILVAVILLARRLRQAPLSH
jgi:hypothetical protein